MERKRLPQGAELPEQLQARLTEFNAQFELGLLAAGVQPRRLLLDNKTGICPVCERIARLRDDGTLTNHYGNGPFYCTGVGKKPVQASTN